MRTKIATTVLACGLAASVTGPAQLPPRICAQYDGDPRLERLRSFFEAYRCPAAPYAREFLLAADLHGLDWRLLPSIAFVETGAGKTAQGNNLFGWDSGRTEFASVPHAIHWVAWRLATSRLYADKDLGALLRTYNPRPRYPRVVNSIMTRLALH
ncbi:MAG: hypothetical protein ACP5U2_06525 [Bryobacteraceae bacterium]